MKKNEKESTSCNDRVCGRRKLLSKELLISEQVGYEALKFDSIIGQDDYLKRVREQELLKFFKLPESSQHRDLIYPFDGYISDSNEIDVETLTESVKRLQSIYGKDQLYDACFVRTFHDTTEKSYMKVKESLKINEALERGFDAGVNLKSGFFILVVEGNEYRPKDILIWNNSGKKWISYYRSKGYVYGKHKEDLRCKFLERHHGSGESLEEVGIYAQPHIFDYHCASIDPVFVRVTKDGVIWQQFSTETDEGLDLWEAWDKTLYKGLYILYNPHNRIIKYLDKETGIVYLRSRNLRFAVEARKYGYRTIELASVEMELKVNREDFPNVFYYSYSGCEDGNKRIEQPLESIIVDTEIIGMETLNEKLNKLREISRKIYLSNPDIKLYIEKDYPEWYNCDCLEYLEIEEGWRLKDSEYGSAILSGLE